MTQPTTLITGAGRRIGAAIATHLAGRGHDLVLHYHRSEDAAQTLAETLRAQHGITVDLWQADLTALDPQNMPAHAVRNIVHNAAQFSRNRLEDFSAQELRTHLAVNLEAPLLLSQWFAAQLPAGAAGNVIVLGDGAEGQSISPEFFTYAASKLAWKPIIELLAAALAPRARANLIALGPTLPGEIDDATMHARLAARAPLRQSTPVDDIFQAIDFLLATSSVTGQTISLANGLGLRSRRD